MLSIFLVGFIVAFLFFMQSGESIYDNDDSDLFYDIYNTINQYNGRHTHNLSSILNYLGLSF